MQLKPNTEKALDGRVKPSTWYTDHAEDMRRFHRFVDQYQRDHGFTMDEAGMQELIEKKTNSTDKDDLCEIIAERVSLAYSILEFLRDTGR